MLDKDERRRLAEIEDGLSADDPDFVHRLTHPRTLTRSGWASLRLVVGVISAVLALACVFLGEGAAFLTASVLAVVLIAAHRWDIGIHG